VSQKGTEVAAELPLDYFEPGRCEWHAAALSYHLRTKNGAISEGLLARSLIGMVSPDPFAPTNVRNMWCWQSASPWENRGYVCNDGISRSSRASLKDISAARQGNTQEISIPPIQSGVPIGLFFTILI
jgi:hypothetical protein